MVSDHTPFIANLFLHYFENKWILNLKNLDLHKAPSFTNTFPFIDDLYHGNGLFEKHLKEIYPKELELKQKTFPDLISDSFPLKNCY